MDFALGRRGASGSWISLCLEALHWLLKFCPHTIPADRNATFQEWIPIIRLDVQWKAKIKAAAKSCKHFRWEEAKQTVWTKKLERMFIDHQVCLDQQETAVMNHRWQCDICQQTFASKCALAMHAHKMHAYRSILRYYAVGDECQVCLKKYHVRHRLRAHLTTSKTCLETLMACYPAISEQEADALDELDRQSTGWLVGNQGVFASLQAGRPCSSSLRE